MRNNVVIIKIMSFIIFASTLIGCQNISSQRGGDSISSIYWMQNSSEYRALAYQAYNIARERFDSSSMKVVVMDLDETVFDNISYSAWGVYNNQKYSDETWNLWVNDGIATAIPGSVEFVNYVQLNKGEIFFVSNRLSGTKKVTLENLAKLGIKNIDDDHILLRNSVSSKSSRFFEVARKAGQPIMYIGDNITDFGPYVSNLKERDEFNLFVEDNKKQFGHMFIILPNPVYGSWMPRNLEKMRNELKFWK